MMIRMGSLAMVRQNKASAGPNEMRLHPTNSLMVMMEDDVLVVKLDLRTMENDKEETMERPGGRNVGQSGDVSLFEKA